MDYKNIYEKLISKRQKIIPEGYVENHHIIPLSLGGTNEECNLVKLTAREHFIAHALLVKIYPNSNEMICALKMMSVGKSRRYFNSRIFEANKLKFSKFMSQKQKGHKNQTGEKNNNFGKVWIYNTETLGTDKIHKTLAIPKGWEIGRKPKKLKEYKLSKREKAIERNKPLVEKLLKSNIDFSKFGWVNLASRVLNKRPQKVNVWMKKYMPNFFEDNCFKRKHIQQ